MARITRPVVTSGLMVQGESSISSSARDFRCGTRDQVLVAGRYRVVGDHRVVLAPGIPTASQLKQKFVLCASVLLGLLYMVIAQPPPPSTAATTAHTATTANTAEHGDHSEHRGRPGMRTPRGGFDVATVRAAQRGDQAALRDLLAETLPLVYNIVGFALNAHADVDDAVQETMVRAVCAAWAICAIPRRSGPGSSPSPSGRSTTTSAHAASCRTARCPWTRR